MFFLNRKRIYIILSCLILLITVFQISGTNEVNLQETVALPVNNKTIIIDAGHGRRRSEEL